MNALTKHKWMSQDQCFPVWGICSSWEGRAGIFLYLYYTSSGLGWLICCVWGWGGDQNLQDVEVRHDLLGNIGLDPKANHPLLWDEQENCVHLNTHLVFMELIYILLCCIFVAISKNQCYWVFFKNIFSITVVLYLSGSQLVVSTPQVCLQHIIRWFMAVLLIWC